MRPAAQVIGSASADVSQNLVKDYVMRWGIETLFGIFKTRGFCLESTHFTADEPVKLVVCLADLSLVLGDANRFMVASMAAR